MKTVLVTGGAGFIGSHVVERLLAEGDRVVCLDNFDSFYDPAVKRANIRTALNRPNVRLVEGDIRDEPTLARLFREEPIEVVFHAAARAGVRPSIQDPVLYHDVNLNGTTRLLEAARSARVKNFVFASSSSVYGVANRVPFSEEDPADFPISPYAATKRAGELLCYTYHHLYGVPMTCLRFFTVYGPRQRPEMAIAKFTRLIDEGRPVPVFGDGSSRRDYTYISDVVEGVVEALGHPQPYAILNIGGSQTTELRDLVAKIEKALNKKAQIEVLPPQAGDVPLTFADVGKAKRLLGYEPRTSIDEGLKKFVEWYQEKKNLTKENP
ncbi:MAG TPA: GDP-mannose 4,6-dehydratase [Nitrospiria bacterium]|nr:GDP-mannose 4,6-dehydratase [Nitrospiria bacterium]